ncbi:MAG: 6-phospho-3-hexuloisomerase [Candidatus Bathyarchaeota archaeon]|nr:6-phospho-3-hexuloisomerase [Candidatus Bathyarchaeota archaeon]MDH5494386.1 6-phospho-3-hexuloisomerase [Candidatus Bathyarchaeota archaeon]
MLKAAARELLAGAQKAIEALDSEQVEKMLQMIIEAQKEKIFVVGVGRSGFVGRSFALRLMNLGFNVYFLGETITPAGGKNDLVIAISGTGMTKMVLTASTAAKDISAKVIAVTTYAKSPLGDIADHIVVLTGRTKMGWPREEDYLSRQILGEREPLSPLGSIFENNCTIFLDSLIVELMYRLNKTEEELRRKHATIE